MFPEVNGRNRKKEKARERHRRKTASLSRRHVRHGPEAGHLSASEGNAEVWTGNPLAREEGGRNGEQSERAKVVDSRFNGNPMDFREKDYDYIGRLSLGNRCTL